MGPASSTGPPVYSITKIILEALKLSMGIQQTDAG